MVGLLKKLRNIRVRARAYCSSANLGIGFDVVAVSLNAFYDEVELEIFNGKGDVRIVSIEGPFAENVSAEVNTASEALKAIIEDFQLPVDVNVKLWKGIPVGYGLGSSGASAAAAIRALADALKLNIPCEKAIEYSGFGEKASAGEPHYDNVSASMLGGLIVLHSVKPPIKVSKLSLHGIAFVISIPLVKVPQRKTELMRKILPRTLDLKTHVVECAKLSALLLGLISRSWDLVALGMDGGIVESLRSQYVPCYHVVKKYAKEAGAVNTALSGAGPGLITLVSSANKAWDVAKAVLRAYRECGIEAEVKIAKTASEARTTLMEVINY